MLEMPINSCTSMKWSRMLCISRSCVCTTNNEFFSQSPIQEKWFEYVDVVSSEIQCGVLIVATNSKT